MRDACFGKHLRRILAEPVPGGSLRDRTFNSRGLKTSPLVERQVRALLTVSPAYRQIPAELQRQIAGSMVKIGVYLAEPEKHAANQLPGAIAFIPVGEAARDFLDAVNFPEFVANLIQGVFQAIVDASIQQMEAYAELLNAVAKTVDQFVNDHVTDETGRDWLATTYPEYLVRDPKSGDLRLLPNFDHAEAIRRFRLLPLACPLKKLRAADIETVLVPASRRRIAAARQQLLASMVLMGVNREFSS